MAQSSSSDQVKWGAVLAAIVIAAVLVLALVPDPLHRQRVMTVGLDQVEGIAKGTPIFFRGAPIGAVRAVTLVPQLRTFDLRIGIRRDWQPSACSFMTVAASNPFTQPHLELVAAETSAAGCSAARATARCEPVLPVLSSGPRILGCRRAPDLIALATGVVTRASGAADTAAAMALKLQTMIDGGGGGAAGVAGDLKGTVRSLAQVLGGVDRSLAPGRGDLALTLANVRRATDRAAQIDVGAINGTLGSVQTIVSGNRDNVSRIVSDGQAITAQTRDLMQNTSRSLADTSANLARISSNMDVLTERMSADPTFAVRGQNFADPPPVVAK